MPGIKELFEQAPPLIEKTNKTDLYKNIDAEYYGYRDDEDGELVKLEKEQELKNEGE